MIQRWIETCGAGFSVGCALGWNHRSPIRVQGGKRAYSLPILELVGLRPGGGAAEYFKAQPGPFGSAWKAPSS